MTEIQNPAIAGGKRSKSGKPIAYIHQSSTNASILSIAARQEVPFCDTLHRSVSRNLTEVNI